MVAIHTIPMGINDTWNSKRILPYLNFGLVWIYGTYTIVRYLMPNPFLYIYKDLFQAIQFRLSMQFKCEKFYLKQFSLA